MSLSARDGLRFGDKAQAHPPHIEADVKRLIDEGAKVYVVANDAAERGLEGTDLVDGLERVPRQGVASLCASYDQVWHW